MIAIVDYGVGNLFSITRAFESLGADIEVTGDASHIAQASAIVLPGVGAFGDAADKLSECGLDAVLCEQAAAGKPLIGICLGMQLLFEESYEYGVHKGLGLIPGKVTSMRERVSSELKIPQIGWNALQKTNNKSSLLKYVDDGEYVYFVHSFSAVDCDDFVTSTCDYGGIITASVERENVMGCQFHPEKSGDVGMKILRRFLEMVGE